MAWSPSRVNGFVPSALIHPPRVPGVCNGDDTGHDVWRARKRKCNVAAKTQGLHNRRKKILEITGGHVEVLHSHENPEVLVSDALVQPFPDTSINS